MTLGFELANEFGTSMRQLADATARLSRPLWSNGITPYHEVKALLSGVG